MPAPGTTAVRLLYALAALGLISGLLLTSSAPSRP
jgi:hypothetical protein